jgi:hypothetical protein
MTEYTALLVDADSKERFGNLALMKLSAYYKSLGWSVDLIMGLPLAPPIHLYDASFISVIYHQNYDRALDYALMLPNCQVGGSGWDIEKKLPDEIEHIMPDYSLYDLDYSMGFTSRGCIRNCGFCVVPKKEGPIRDHAHIMEFHHQYHHKIMLLDNNFLASPRWKENLQYIEMNKLKVNFNQGLDIRLIDEEKAKLLSEIKYYSWNFKTRSLHFAFDDLRYEKEVFQGIDILESAGIPPKHLMFYVLIGYNTTEEQDLHRIYSLKDRGVRPYVMPYNRTKSKLTRFVNRMYIEFLDWEEYNK